MPLTRVYLALTAADLDRLADEGTLGAARRPAHAVTPAVGTPGLTTDAEDRLRIEVSDEDSRLPRFEPVGDDALGGRGLTLVAALAGAHGVRASDLGKTVWVDLIGPAGRTSAEVTVQVRVPPHRVPAGS